MKKRACALACTLAFATLLAGCKRDNDSAKKVATPLEVSGAIAAATPPEPPRTAEKKGKKGKKGALADGDGGTRVGTKVVPAGPLPDTARFVSVAALRRHPLFAAFAELVETEDDQEESTSSETKAADADAEEEDDDDDHTSPDRPPSDLTITRIGLAGEIYVLAYEENCGEDLEDKRNLSQVLLERRAGTLQELFRKTLCGEAQKGMTVELVQLTALGPELVVRSWIIDPDGSSEHSLRAFRVSPEGLMNVGLVRDAIDGAVRFDASFPQKGPLAEIELGVQVRDDSGADRRELIRYTLAPSGFARVGVTSAPPSAAGAPAHRAPVPAPAR